LAAQDSRVSYRRHHVNKGHIDTYNEGIEWTSASYALLLSADDYLLPGALSRATTLLEENPQAGFSFGNAIEVHGDPTIPPTHVRPVRESRGSRILTGRQFVELSGDRNIVPTPTAVVRTRLQKRIGGYRRDLPHSGDMEMWLRFAAKADVGFVDVEQAAYRRHATNMSHAYSQNRSLGDIQQRKAAFDCFFANADSARWIDGQLQNSILRKLSATSVHSASGALNEGNRPVADELLDLALTLCPEMRKTWLWRRIALKKRFSPRTLLLLQRFLTTIKGLTTSPRVTAQRTV
jgi:hypothetical protein